MPFDQSLYALTSRNNRFKKQTL